MKNQKTQKDHCGHWFKHNALSYSKLKERIKKNEGFSTKPYKDQLGFKTIGFGHLILSNEKQLLNSKLSKADLEKIFINDFNKALTDYNKFLKPYSSNKKDTDLLIEMVFQLGTRGVLRFKKLLSHMIKQDKHLVCFEMMNSLWYKQTPNRVKKLIKVFLNNER